MPRNYQLTLSKELNTLRNEIIENTYLWQNKLAKTLFRYNFTLSCQVRGAPLRKGDRGVRYFLGPIFGSFCPLQVAFSKFLSGLGPIFRFIQPVNSLIRNVWCFLVVSNCHKLSAKFLSGRFNVIEKVGYLSYFFLISCSNGYFCRTVWISCRVEVPLLYLDCKTHRHLATETFLVIFSLTACELLQHVTALCCVAFVQYGIKHLFHETYVLLHFEHKNDVTIIIKLHRATHRFIQQFDNDCDVMFIFKMWQNIDFHGTSVKL